MEPCFNYKKSCAFVGGPMISEFSRLILKVIDVKISIRSSLRFAAVKK